MHSKPGRAQPLPIEHRRESILEATVPLLMAHGADVTTKQVAEAAGIAEGTLFRAFPDKDALIEAAVERFLDPAPTLAALRGLDPHLPFEDLIEQIAVIIQRRVTGVMGIMSALGVRKPPPLPASAREVKSPSVAAALLEPHRERLSVEPDDAIHFIRVVVMGEAVAALPFQRRLSMQQMVQFIMHGITEE